MPNSTLKICPSDTALLHHLVRDMAGAVESRDGEIERLQSIIKKLQRAQFGRRSERLDPDQLALALEDLDSDVAPRADKRPRSKQARNVSGWHGPGANRCPNICRAKMSGSMPAACCACCGGMLHAIGESVSEMLDWVPAQLRVLRIARRNTLAVAAGRSRRRRRRNVRLLVEWRRRRCSRRC